MPTHALTHDTAKAASHPAVDDPTHILEAVASCNHPVELIVTEPSGKLKLESIVRFSKVHSFSKVYVEPKSSCNTQLVHARHLRGLLIPNVHVRIPMF